MCQVDEDYNGQLDRDEVLSFSKKCVKCKEATAVLVIRAGDMFCSGCFKEYFVHKFRAMLGKNRIIFPGERVLLAVSGGPSSCSMLNQVQEGLSQNAHKKLRFIPGIVYIDEGGALGLSVEERQRTVDELQSMFKATGFPYHILPLEEVFDLPSSVLEESSPSSEQPDITYKAAVDHFIQTNRNCYLSPEKQADLTGLNIQESHTHSLQQIFGSIKTLTAKEDLLQTLRQHLLVHTARSKGYSKLMLGDNCTRLAVKLLASISLGRGAQLAIDTGFSDLRYGDIITVRPMRDYSAKEVSFYNHMYNVPSVFIPTLDTKTTDKASVLRLTESFVTKLQAHFPSTVSTIYRTSEKLQTIQPSPSSSTAHNWDKCLLCMCALDTNVEKASAFQATLISELLSQRRASRPVDTASPTLRPEFQGPESTAAGGVGCERAACGGGCCSSVKAPESTELKSLLCYSCQLTIKDMSSADLLPQYILSEAQRRKRRSQMREEIREFLLDEDY
ncbi:cytoplasmic tRNA 2-thiolation protein 2 isoform X2 [Myripristis murdjan]|uniref:cytoplasmic tRNA 2-thiolation protein 2 isoform X2 n=1 Tax=Myripristis murdjan TaxID=586833 RepID=UPI001176342C|nr:cytoplasmic tRNA 2-thiolation protein 2 isoform X2 [Myripristis murdjan]